MDWMVETLHWVLILFCNTQIQFGIEIVARKILIKLQNFSFSSFNSNSIKAGLGSDTWYMMLHIVWIWSMLRFHLTVYWTTKYVKTVPDMKGTSSESHLIVYLVLNSRICWSIVDRYIWSKTYLIIITFEKQYIYFQYSWFTTTDWRETNFRQLWNNNNSQILEMSVALCWLLNNSLCNILCK